MEETMLKDLDRQLDLPPRYEYGDRLLCNSPDGGKAVYTFRRELPGGRLVAIAPQGYPVEMNAGAVIRNFRRE